SRVLGACAGHAAISQITVRGAVFCQPIGAGSISGVLAGADLTGGGTSGQVTLSADETKLQRRLTSGCPSGTAIQGIDQTGNPNCTEFGSGSVTSVGAGTGLTGGPVTSSGRLSLAAGYQLPQSCASGQVPAYNGSNAWTCKNGGAQTVVASVPAG